MAFFGSLAIAVGSGLIVNAIGSKRNQRINRASEVSGYRQDLVNARGNLAFQIRAGEMRGNLAGMNTAQILEVTAINKSNIEAARDRTVDLMQIEKSEELRRHIKDEVILAGNIRLGYATAGVQSTTGSAKAVKITEMKEAKLSRLYQDMVSEKQIIGFFQTETERARLVEREGQLAAEAATANAEFETAVLVAEAEQAVSNTEQNLREAGG